MYALITLPASASATWNLHEGFPALPAVQVVNTDNHHFNISEQA